MYVSVSIIFLGSQWALLIFDLLGVLESKATDLLVRFSLLIQVHNILTLRQERLGTTFWIDVPNWVQVPNLCPNLQNDMSLLQYKTTVLAPYPNNVVSAQAQQVTDSFSTHSIQSPPTQSPSNPSGTPSPSAGFSSEHTTSNPGQQQSTPTELHIFMTSKVGGHYLLSQWNTFLPRPQNDQDFFRKLRECYISARGSWRYYLGLKVFSHCEFYRVSCLTLWNTRPV
jgi:hypothetical protein